MTSNIVECTNTCLVEARESLEYNFVEEVRQMFARWNFKNHIFASHTFSTLCGKPQEMLVDNEEQSAHMKKKHFDPGPYCSDMYKPSNLLIAYNIPITPLPDPIEWNVPGYIKDDIVRPPKYKRLPERPPKKYRDKVYNVLYGKKSKNFWSTCGYKGCNRRSCRNGLCIA
ncbi:hypothetical protein KY284_007994 [Solanum tuberosum]|nr:hypothetical protein KY284_007994 [Solanum tuberosum]